MVQGTNPRTGVSVGEFAAAAVGPLFATADDVDPLLNPRPAGKAPVQWRGPGLSLDYPCKATGTPRYTLFAPVRVHPGGAIEALAQVRSSLRPWRVREAAAIALGEDGVRPRRASGMG
jgi:hypothetical protein